MLKRANYRVTTIKNMMSNVKGFIKHVDLFHRSTSKITGVQMGQIQQTIKALQSDILRDVVSHRQTIKKKKSRKFLFLNLCCKSHFNVFEVCASLNYFGPMVSLTIPSFVPLPKGREVKNLKCVQYGVSCGTGTNQALEPV